ncbi:MAG: helix-turn-helix domain-containing protein [Lachnospiraceae bacterium]|nr:helix-turn-helix domain-containing protein [Lachnospiraceae bacterium]MDD7179026.1 helix-turn-helix transcriptional regulator [bacterium]MDY5517065.1 helix-turn-helix transcriptional regulator [Lachnospiraceae bacterium]
MIETLGSRIAQLRQKNGMSQTDLAKRLNISRAGVQSWECGENYPSTDNLISLSKIFHVSTDYLLNINATKTISLDHYSKDEQNIIFRLLQYFDGTACTLEKG